ncbi:hypothetical protein BH23CHL2_BH23CHL2_15820 [soil metagenome]
MQLLRVFWVALIVAGGSALTLTPATAVEIGDDAFYNTWSRTDLPVAGNQATRTWMWGPAAFTSAMEEWYEEGVGNARVVQYFDKSRMEISTDPAADPSSIWYVTNGLLVVELMTGNLQLGDGTFDQGDPANVNVAGDANDPNGPTYVTFASVRDDFPLADGAPISQRLARDGTVTDAPDFGSYGVTAAYHVQVPGIDHQVASPFWDFMNSSGVVVENGQTTTAPLFQDPFYATGYPLTEAYWSTVLVGGGPQDVLVQCFERRCLTYTPSNPPEWQVEAGNVGQHYYRWRYQTEIPSEPPPVEIADFEPMGPNFLPNWPLDYGGEAFVSFGNQAPFEMIVQLDGPVSRTITVPACPGCEVYSVFAPPTFCRDDIPWHDEYLPPGNYRLQISWSGSDTSPLAGPQTYVPDAGYGTCFFILEGN